MVRVQRRIPKQPPLRAASALSKSNKSKLKSEEYVHALATTCKQIGLPEFTREHAFHSARRWRFDAAWLEVRLACEIEGGIHSGGRHVRGVGFEKDMHKYNEAACLGWVVIRVSPDMVKTGVAALYLSRAYERLTAEPASVG